MSTFWAKVGIKRKKIPPPLRTHHTYIHKEPFGRALLSIRTVYIMLFLITTYMLVSFTLTLRNLIDPQVLGLTESHTRTSYY